MKKYLSNKNLNSQYFSDLAGILFNDFSPKDLDLSKNEYYRLILAINRISAELSKRESEGLTYPELLARLKKQLGVNEK